MSDYKKYTELDVWKNSRELVKIIYNLTKKFPKEETYGLMNQMRRCSISVPSNIAEGCGRQHSKDSIQFFYIARGSLYELETQLYLCLDQNYINSDDFKMCLEKIEVCQKLLSGFINYYQKL
jgi:four helix bundle protein